MTIDQFALDVLRAAAWPLAAYFIIHRTTDVWLGVTLIKKSRQPVTVEVQDD